ncbi:hypothetical protein ACFSM5_14780 [Lacibacterium aquatile]|uniref:Uncharacterized protein n=1 Tax=Lacibacterium aquatile TaxID=1168082 RepID=A0ABW5DWJ0_9PROT
MTVLLGSQVRADEFADERRILKVELTISGTESWKEGTNWEKGKIAQRYFFATVVKRHKELSTENPLDPNYATDAMAKANKAQAKIAQTQENLRKKGISTGPAPMSQQDLMAAAQKIMALCKGDQACQQREGMKLMPQMMGGVQMPPTGAAPVQDDEEEVEETAKFQSWFGYEGCPTKLRATVNDTAEGGLADVGGVVPTQKTVTADYVGLDAHRTLQCLGYQSVVDVMSKTLYTRGFFFPIVRGKTEFKEGGRRITGSEDGELAALPGDVATWASGILQKAPLSGSQSGKVKLTDPVIVLPISNARYEGTVDVKLTWSFVETLAAKADASKLPDK